MRNDNNAKLYTYIKIEIKKIPHRLSHNKNTKVFVGAQLETQIINIEIVINDTFRALHSESNQK